MSGAENGKTPIPTGTYLDVTRQSHGPAGLPRDTVAAIASQRVLAGGGQARLIQRTANTQVQGPGGLPEGFGTQLNWTGEEDFALLAHVTARDPQGLCVSGVRDGDTYVHVGAWQKASFAAGGSSWLSGLITAAADGLQLAADAFGAQALDPLIQAGAGFAQQHFTQTRAGTQERTAYGVDNQGRPARQEGGVIACQATAEGVFHSGDSDHQDRWIQGDGIRSDANMPRHIPAGQAFFLQDGMTPQTLHGNGDLLLAAWDWKFEDNSGSYLIHAILRRGHQSRS